MSVAVPRACLRAPHGTLLTAAEAFAVAGLDALPDNGEVAAFAGFASWLAEADAELPLHRVVEGFALGASEAALLALLFAAALSEPVARRVAAAANGGHGVPLWLAQRLIPDLPAETLVAAAPLRRFGLVAIQEDAPRIEARLTLRAAVLDRFCGAPGYESEVEARIVPLLAQEALTNDALARLLRAALAERGPDRLSPVVLTGRNEPAMVAASLAALGLKPHLLVAANIPDDADARDRLARHWSREAALDASVLMIAAQERASLVTDFADRVTGHVVVSGLLAATGFHRALRIIGDAATLPADPSDRWGRALGCARARKLGGGVARVAAQFRLEPQEIDAVCVRVAAEIDAAGDAREATSVLWHAAGRVSLAAPVPGVSVVEPAYQWRDIVLAAPIEAALRRVEAHVRHATTVMDDWGFAERMGGRGRGVVALFSGPSGTGKTMAAEVLASSLDLRMMVIDLSQIISKYVGETSKNIAAAFDQAERCGAVMVWNEGDAVWGARGTVGNATDRHVNAEIGDLLQRIEAFRGFTVVTTNMRHAIDPAFLRRFRFAIDFPMPSERERLRLWQQVFPQAAPVDLLDWSALAALPLSGGSIRNVALGSAFLAAEAGGRIDRGVILAEFAEEMRKHNLPVPAIDWQMPQ
jgi:hypothetical protein